MTTYTGITVKAGERWNPTGVDVKAGQTVRFKAQGWWVDLVIPCGPAGWKAAWLYDHGLPPVLPDYPQYFALAIGLARVSKNPTAADVLETYIIGCERTIPVQKDGFLFAFANDREGFYGNNWGSLRLDIVIFP